MSTNALTQSYTIKEAASLTGLPESTLRYYESIGIIDPIQRGESSKHRVYSEQDLSVLDAIACLSATGMSVADMRQYIKNRDNGIDTADEQAELLETQKRHLVNEAKLLKVRQEYVDLKIAYWHAVKAHKDDDAEAISVEARKLTDVLKQSNRR